jgi:hypothetical protein
MATGGDKLKPHAAQLEAWAIEAIPVVEQVRRLAGFGVKVGRQAVYKWQQRHDVAISVPKAIVKQVVVGRSQTIAISDRSERIRRAGVASDKVMEWIETHGLITETQRTEDDETVIDRRFNRGLVSALVDLNMYVAKELGEFQPDQPAVTPPEVHATFQTLILADPSFRELAERLFVSAAMGARDAGGARLVRKRGDVAAGAAPDADQQRLAADRLR